MPNKNVLDKFWSTRGAATGPTQREYVVAASTTIIAGDFLTLNSSGQAIPLITAVANAYTNNGVNATCIGRANFTIVTDATGFDTTTAGSKGYPRNKVSVVLADRVNEFLVRIGDATSSNTNQNDVVIGGKYKVGVYLATGLAATDPSRVYYLSPTTKAITGATNAAPIVLTSTGHGIASGERISVSGVGGNTAANRDWFTATATDANTITIPGSQGNAAYTSGGVVVGSAMLEVTGLYADQSDTDTYALVWTRFVQGAIG